MKITYRVNQPVATANRFVFEDKGRVDGHVEGLTGAGGSQVNARAIRV